MRLLLFLLVVSVGIVFGWWLSNGAVTMPNPSPDSAGQQQQQRVQLIEAEPVWMVLDTPLGSYRAVWEVITPDRSVRVGINQNLEQSSQQLLEQSACTILTSAAFYDTNNRPLGLLVDQGATLSAWRNNQLLHGVVGYNDVDRRIVIARDILDERWRWAVQAGPIVWRDGKAVQLQLAVDQLARRVVAGVTDDGDLVLLVLVGLESNYSGPLLADVPSVLSAWQEVVDIRLSDGLNLDGGTASSFLSPSFRLRELKPIGSYICVD